MFLALKFFKSEASFLSSEQKFALSRFCNPAYNPSGPNKPMARWCLSATNPGANYAVIEWLNRTCVDRDCGFN
jgi:hypothetical protein